MDVGLLTVFTGSRAIANGTREELVSVIRQLSAAGGPAVLVFDDLTGEQVDLDLRDQGYSGKARPSRAWASQAWRSSSRGDSSPQALGVAQRST